MRTKIVELTNGFNWGKFLVCRFDEEWVRKSAIDPTSIALLRQCGWGEEHLGVFDLATGEGAFFRAGGNAHTDLEKHAIWVCPMFEPFLAWLYRQPDAWVDLDKLPELVELSDKETRERSAIYGHRREGPSMFERIVRDVIAMQSEGPLTREGVEAILTHAMRSSQRPGLR